MGMEQTTRLVWGFPIASGDVSRVRDMIEAGAVRDVEAFDIGEARSNVSLGIVGYCAEMLAQGRYETIDGPVLLSEIAPHDGPEASKREAVLRAAEALAAAGVVLAGDPPAWWIVGSVS